MKLVYTYALGAYALRRAGSSPVSRTIFGRHNGDIAHLTLKKSIPIRRGVFLFGLINSNSEADRLVMKVVLYSVRRRFKIVRSPRTHLQTPLTHLLQSQTKRFFGRVIALFFIKAASAEESRFFDKQWKRLLLYFMIQ